MTINKLNDETGNASFKKGVLIVRELTENMSIILGHIKSNIPENKSVFVFNLRKKGDLKKRLLESNFSYDKAKQLIKKHKIYDDVFELSDHIQAVTSCICAIEVYNNFNVGTLWSDYIIAISVDTDRIADS